MSSIIALSFLVSAERADAGQTITIDFEAFPGPDGLLGTPDDIPITAPALFIDQTNQLTNEFSSLGVLFTPNPPTQDQNEILNNSSFSVPPDQTPPNLLASNGSLTISGRFTVPVFEVGALLGISAGSDRLEIFDASNASLGSIVGDDTFQSLSSLTPIDHFVISAAVGETPAIDNFTFTVNAVPEPSTLLMAVSAVGLLGCGWLRRRRIGRAGGTGTLRV